MKRLLILLTLVAAAGTASAQAPPQTPADATTNVAVDPIRCWWRTTKGEVRIGEHFELWLTCAVLENESVQVVPDQSHLGVEVVALAPFEVIGGSHPADLRSGQRRFFQYQYILRIINPDAIGKDTNIPVAVLHYKVNSRVAENTSLQGRDLTYILPAESVRVSSMVPTNATDIRDQAGESFGIVESLGLRAGILEIVAITSIVLGSLMVIFVAVRLLGRARLRKPAHERTIATRRVLGAAIGELSSVQREREQQGWNEALAGRALAATRIAAACAVGRPVNQLILDSTNGHRDGRVLATAWLRGKPRLLSSPITAGDVARRLSATSASDPATQQMLDDLKDALKAFSVTQYGRDQVLDATSLDSALSSAKTAAQRARSQHAWIKTALRQLVRGGAPVETRA